MVSDNPRKKIQKHLDKAALEGGYLDAINGTSPESLIDGQMKMLPLKLALGDVAIGASVLSVGVGQGEELHALRSVMGPNVTLHGVDLSLAALQRTFQRDEDFDLNIQVMLGDARQLPFEADSLNAVVESAVLHEVYSYNEPEGALAYNEAIADAVRVLKPGGILYVREFACPKPEGPLKLQPLTPEASEFYDYFLAAFTIGLNGNTTHAIQLDTNGYLTRTGDVTQVLMHFRNFWNDATKDLTKVGDLDWKELKESYLIPSEIRPDQYMDPEEFCENVIDIAIQSGSDLELVKLALIDRKRVNLFLEQHFKIVDSNNRDATSRVLELATAKFEAIFRKAA